MDPKKPIGPRRVWRMTSENPLGEVLELVAKTDAWKGSRFGDSSPPVEAPAVVPKVKRTFHPETTAAASRATATAAAAQASPVAEKGVPPAELPARVLNPAQVPNWRSSSFDLLSGLTVRDVTDTIPGEVFEEIFKPRRPLPRVASKRR